MSEENVHAATPSKQPNKVVEHLKKHKNKYIVGGVIVGASVVSIVVFKRVAAVSASKKAADAAIAAEPMVPYILGEGEKLLKVSVRPSHADAFNKAAEAVKNSPIVSVEGERFRMPDIYETGPLTAYDNIYKAVKNQVGPAVDEIFTVDSIPKLRPVSDAA